MEEKNRKFNFEGFTYKLLAIIFIVIFFYVAYENYITIDDKKDFIVMSKKPDNVTSDKEDAVVNAKNIINDVFKKNEAMLPTNLNIAKMYGEVTDNDATTLYSAYVPIPVVSDEVMKSETTFESNVAYQIFAKLQMRYTLYSHMLSNLYSETPEAIATKYGYDINKILGKFNPDNPYHMIEYPNTYKIPNFQNVNIYTTDGDNNAINDDNNIKDIMSMASVYTYYHDPYNYNRYLEYCYDLFDKSYTYVASISEVYYCSGCVNYDIENEELLPYYTENIPTYEKMSNTLHVKNRLPKELPYKSGKLVRFDNSKNFVNTLDYDTYINVIKSGKFHTNYNYCPGHVDLNVYLKVLTIEADNSLFDIDNRFGNNETNFSLRWRGWDAYKIKEARDLYYKDWNKEYGISLSSINSVTPLTREEINYYLNKIDDSVSSNRKKVIETALKSVGRIPYYYGGKSSTFGYESANFGRKVLPDYKGRCLKGLDCSGWVNWVYNTTFRRVFVSADGTAKLAATGNKIRREELKPGDLIVRPGHDSHVMMFLEWGPGGKVTVIHENGTANNVSIGTYDAYYPYYRSIFDM